MAKEKHRKWKMQTMEQLKKGIGLGSLRGIGLKY